MSDINASQPHDLHQPLLSSGWGVATILALSVLLVHGWSLGDGLSLDDHWHYHKLKTAQPTFGQLFSVTTIDADEIGDLWWRDKPVRFKYARPLAMGIMRFVYAVSGWQPVAVHALSLTLHWAAALLIWRLLRRIVNDRWCALWAALFFVAYPLSIFAVSWPAAQNMLLMTCLMLGSLLAFTHATGWRAAPTDHSTPHPHRTRTGAMTAAFLLWLAALASRENAVMLPVIFLAMDYAMGRWKLVRSRMGWHALFMLTALAFAAWRVGFYAETMPDGYVRRLGDDGFVPWCIAKLLFYWACSVWPAPMVIGPSARYHPFTEAPSDYITMALLVAGFMVAYTVLARRVRGWWIWPLWIVLATLPVTTVMATPHSGYLCGVAVAIGAVIALGRLRTRPNHKYRKLVSVSMVVVLIGAGGICKLYRLMWRAMDYAEQVVFSALANDPPPPSADVFMINLPFAATYARLWMSEAIGCDIPPDRFHILTYSPSAVRAESVCIVQRSGPSQLSIGVDSPGWFSGFLGQFLINGMRTSGALAAGEVLRTPHFDIRILAADTDGVQKIEFTFAQPLDSEQYAFYLSSPQCGAMRLRFNEAPTGQLPPPGKTQPSLRQMESAMQSIRRGDAASADVLFAAALANDPPMRKNAWRMLQDTVGVVAVAVGSPVQTLFEKQNPAPTDIDRLRRWWRRSAINHRTIDAVFAHREQFLEWIDRRDELARGRALMGSWIRSDLYLTGPPFPGPR